jgi:hypothetical protein
MTHEWRKSSSLRDLLVLYRDSLFAASIVRRAAWEPVVPLDACPMRPDDRAEVERKLKELNKEKPCPT